MSNKPWKNLERKVAKVLGGQRIPSSGNGAMKGDVFHPIYHIECKWGNQIPKWVMREYQFLKDNISDEVWYSANHADNIPATILKWFNNAKEQSNNKMPILVMKPKGVRGELVFWEVEPNLYYLTTLKLFAERYHNAK